MNSRLAAILLVTSALAACQSTTPSPQQTVRVQDDIGRLKEDRDAGKISYTEWAERTGAAARANLRLGPNEEAAIAYRTQLARRVDAGEMSPAQFEQESTRTLQRVKAARAGG